MNPAELATAIAFVFNEELSLAIEETTGSDDVYVSEATTYENAGITALAGVVLTLSDGSEYQITVHPSRPAR
jgi:hypothetical protein